MKPPKQGIDFKLLRECNKLDCAMRAFIEHHTGKMRDADFVKTQESGYYNFKFVIPGETRFTCAKCGHCCSEFKSIGNNELNGKPCPELLDNRCKSYSNRYSACRIYPFHIQVDRHGNDLLLLDGLCKGAGTGYMITTERYKTLVRTLNVDFNNLDGVHLIFNRMNTLFSADNDAETSPA